jgi:ribosome-binding factor A
MPKKVTHRVDRVAELLQRELAMLLQHEIQDPRVKGVTITTVKMSPDLRHARIYFTSLDEQQITATTHALNHTVRYLRRRIAEIIELRVVPELLFVYDESITHALHLTQLLNSLTDSDKAKD